MINIKKAVYEHVLTERESKSGKLYPSALGGCIRQEMQRFHKHPKTHPHPDLLLFDFERYKWYEGLIARAVGLGRAALQYPVQNDYWSGKIDMLIPDYDTYDSPFWYLTEIKTISPWAPKKNMPYPHHKAQVWCYWILYEADLTSHDKALLVYIDRWSTKVPRITVLDVTPTEEEVEETKALMATFEEWSRRGPCPHCNGSGYVPSGKASAEFCGCNGDDGLPPRPWSSPQHDDAWRCARYAYIQAEKRKRWKIGCQWFGKCWPQYVDKSGEFEPDLPF